MKKSILWAFSLMFVIAACLTGCSNDSDFEENAPAATSNSIPSTGKFANLQFVDSTGTVVAECPVNVSSDTTSATSQTRSRLTSQPNPRIRILSDKHYGDDCRWVKAVAYPVLMGYGKYDDTQVVGNLYLEITITGKWLSIKASNNFEGDLWTIRILGNNKWLTMARPTYIEGWIVAVVKDHKVGEVQEERSKDKYYLSYQWISLTNHKTGYTYDIYRQ